MIGEDFEKALRTMMTEDGWGLPFSVYEACKASLRIAATVYRDGVIQAAYHDATGNLGGDHVEHVVRKALTYG